MFRPLELFVGLRYTRAKRRNHFISFISSISMLGIILGVTALITVLSVMNGFEKEVRERILGMASHATIAGYGAPLYDWRAVAAHAGKKAEVIGVAPYVQAETMISLGDQVSGVVLRGVVPDEERKVSEVGDKMVAGSLDDLRPGEFGIVLGHELATMLGAALGDKVTVITPQANVTPAGVLPRLKRFTVVGLFEVGMYEYDRGVALVNMDDAARLLQLGDGVTGVRLKLQDMFDAPRLTRELSGEMSDKYYLTDWTRQHANYFLAVKQEKRVMFIILTLIVAVGVFNIVSTLVMVVTDKQADVAILRTLGATPGSVMGIFCVQGLIIGIVGTVLGMVFGVALASNVDVIVPAIERAFGIKFLSPEVYYISVFPTDMHWEDVFRVGVVAFVLTVIATIYPAWRAARIQPAEALRYE